MTETTKQSRYREVGRTDVVRLAGIDIGDNNYVQKQNIEESYKGYTRIYLFILHKSSVRHLGSAIPFLSFVIKI